MVEACNSKLAVEPNHKKALLIRCSALMKKQEIEAALRDCQQVLQISPKNINALYMRGCCKEKLGQVD
jgi:regulator of sirC expression with transglutaminase-like and TPR domain